MAAELVFVVDWLVVAAVLVRVLLSQCVAVDAEPLGIDVELVVGDRVGMPSVVLRVVELVVADELDVVVDWLVVAAVPMEVVAGSVVVGAVPVVVPSVWVKSVLADVVDWVVMAVVPVEVEVIVRETMVVVAAVDVPPVGVLLPSVGVRLWAVLLSVMVDVIMVGLWGVTETGSVAVAVGVMGSAVDTEAFMDVALVVWPDTDNVGKRMPNKRKCRATVKPVLRERKKDILHFSMPTSYYYLDK